VIPTNGIRLSLIIIRMRISMVGGCFVCLFDIIRRLSTIPVRHCEQPPNILYHKNYGIDFNSIFLNPSPLNAGLLTADESVELDSHLLLL
jgi:hypothetical protein